jgi:hypothetical protein
MEDISRELEREIARSKPAPHKKSKKKRVLIVDDMGGVKPGGYLKYFVGVLLCTALVCLAAAGVFFTLFDQLSRENAELVSRTAALESRVAALTRDKETLMARLVMSGRDPDIASDISDPASAVPDPDTGEKKNKEEQEKSRIQAQSDQDTKDMSDTDADVDAGIPQEEHSDTLQQEDPETPLVAEEAGRVDIEKFSVTRDRGQGDLLVRFDIRNVSKKPGEVSGRIFTILKPESGYTKKDTDQWLVVPSSPLDNGIPSHTKKGQYFSIAHFKPVKFRIKNIPGQAFFTTASIYIFNDLGELMFQSDIDIGEEDLG